MSRTEKFKSIRDKIQLILEHFTEDQELNAEIERRFMTIRDSNMRKYVENAAELLSYAGASGLTPKAWAEKFDSLPFDTRTAADMTGPILKATNELFPDHIFQYEGIVRWYDEAMDPEERKQMLGLKKGIGIGVQMSSESMDIVTNSPQPISLRDWGAELSRRTGMPANEARMYLEMHFIPHMNLIARDDRGNYYVPKEEHESAMDMLDKIASGEITIPLNDDEED